MQFLQKVACPVQTRPLGELARYLRQERPGGKLSYDNETELKGGTVTLSQEQLEKYFVPAMAKALLLNGFTTTNNEGIQAATAIIYMGMNGYAETAVLPENDEDVRNVIFHLRYLNKKMKNAD